MKCSLVCLGSLILALVVPLCPAAENPSSKERISSFITEANAKIEKGQLQFDPAEINAAQLLIEKGLVLDPKNPTLLYLKGCALYRSGTIAMIQNEKASAKAQLKDAATVLDSSYQFEANPEVLALHASVLGSLISVGGATEGMTLGPKSGKMLAEAGQKAPNNPRVLLLRGISALMTPPAFGGSVEKALHFFQRSAEKFEAEAAQNPPGVIWGHAEVYAWLGKAQEKSGDLAGARASFEKALSIEPNYGWVGAVLLPQLNEKSK